MSINNDEFEDRVRAAQVRSAYRHTARGLCATGVGAFLIAGILTWVDAVSWPVALAFSLFMLVQIQARLLLITAFHLQDPPYHEWRTWERRFTVGAIIASAGLGGFACLLLPPNQLEMQLLVLLYLCAVGGSAVVSFAVLRPAIYISIASMLLMPTIWM